MEQGAAAVTAILSSTFSFALVQLPFSQQGPHDILYTWRDELRSTSTTVHRGQTMFPCLSNTSATKKAMTHFHHSRNLGVEK